MIPYNRDSLDTIPASSVKIIGLGGAGTNMLERIALDGLEGAELLALNTDLRTLGTSMAKEKIQLGQTLTKGLGTGGDPELGLQAVLEAETEIRNAIKGQRIVFICTGLGGGTGSGAASIVTRIAREEGAFVVVFATMPFDFEGKRRRDQAETALNQLAVLSNALVTFDNNRMGELVLAKQGIREAFVAADKMICESIKAVIRLVVRPGLIHVGLDDLVSALRTNRSRCLFGSGIADGKDRASKALRNALSSPLLDQGALLKNAQTVLVHLCGGENLTLFEIELLMQGLQKHVPESAHILFGAAIDPSMGESLSVTMISAMPEDELARPVTAESTKSEPTATEPAPPTPSPAPPKLVIPSLFAAATPEPKPESPAPAAEEQPAAPPVAEIPPLPSLFDVPPTPPATESATRAAEIPPPADDSSERVTVAEFISSPPEPVYQPGEADPAPIENEIDLSKPAEPTPAFSPIPRKRPQSPPWSSSKETEPATAEEPPTPEPTAQEPQEPTAETESPKLKLGVKTASPQSELSFDSAPRGRFEGEGPNLIDGEDLDLPPFLRKKK